MRPEDWRTIHRLLVVGLDQPTAIEPALQLLKRSLPEIQMTVLNLSQQQLTESVLAPEAILATLQAGKFEAVILFTAESQSPYPIAYLCYLAGIPLRIGQSVEFGGGVLSHCFAPPDLEARIDRHCHLLQSASLPSLISHSTPPYSLQT